jgi:hypothetical protein
VDALEPSVAPPDAVCEVALGAWATGFWPVRSVTDPELLRIEAGRGALGALLWKMEVSSTTIRQRMAGIPSS